MTFWVLDLMGKEPFHTAPCSASVTASSLEKCIVCVCVCVRVRVCVCTCVCVSEWAAPQYIVIVTVKLQRLSPVPLDPCDTCNIGGTNTPSLWVGTNGGHVYVYSLTVPGSDKRSANAVDCLLAKEIKLKHHAPVISIAVIDSKNRVLPEALEVSHERAKAPDMEGQHSVIICSEEQLKVICIFQLCVDVCVCVYVCVCVCMRMRAISEPRFWTDGKLSPVMCIKEQLSAIVCFSGVCVWVCMYFLCSYMCISAHECARMWARESESEQALQLN